MNSQNEDDKPSEEGEPGDAKEGREEETGKEAQHTTYKAELRQRKREQTCKKVSSKQVVKVPWK